MSVVGDWKRRARLAALVLRSGAAGRGRRRAEHPFVTGLRRGQVIPHQGGHWPDAAPNTMAAYERAAARSQVLDVDLWVTADDVLVCSHDDELHSGMTISTSTWAELSADDPPTRFDAVVTAFPNHRLNVEIKTARALDAIRGAMRDDRLCDRTCLSTFNPWLARGLAGAIPRAAHARPTARSIGRIWGPGDVVQTMTFVPDAAAALGSLKPTLLRAVFTAGSPELVGRQIGTARKKGFPIFAWTVNEEPPIRGLVEQGIDAVLSDRPELFDDPEPPSS